jgi:hypothetical protein
MTSRSSIWVQSGMLIEPKNNMDANTNQEHKINNTAKEEGRMTINGNNGNGTQVIFAPKQMADLLSVKVGVVIRELRGGNLRGFKIGKKSWRVSQDDFNDYCSNRINSTNGNRTRVFGSPIFLFKCAYLICTPIRS